MIPPEFDYEVPETLSDAVAILDKNPDAKILSGGQSLLPLMRFRLAEPALIVDINQLKDLNYIKEEDGWLKIGGLTREVDLDKSEIVSKKYPLLADTTKVIADPLVRNLATIGGNLAHADPANDHPATMLAYNAEIVATGKKGERVIPIDEFFVDVFEPALTHDEVLTEIRIPAHKGKSGGAYVKLERKVGDYATAAVAVQLTLDKNGVVSEVGIGLTNVGLTPIKASAAENALRGQQPDDEHLHQAAELAAEFSEPESDLRGTEEYKRSLVKTLTIRALKKAVARANGD
ncbi:MAG: xanthine dehydrogenase family protein subunit M [Chloroflexi bacterium]|nr:xanthine dehydrogenase family protein subunit M [Chloroflexota bacterium]